MTNKMDKKRGSSLLEKKSKGLFSIYMIEHEDGTISILSESVGDASNVLALGIDMMVTLEEVASYSGGGIRVQTHHQSASYQ